MISEFDKDTDEPEPGQDPRALLVGITAKIGCLSVLRTFRHAVLSVCVICLPASVEYAVQLRNDGMQ